MSDFAEYVSIFMHTQKSNRIKGSIQKNQDKVPSTKQKKHAGEKKGNSVAQREVLYLGVLLGEKTARNCYKLSVMLMQESEILRYELE